MLGRYISPGYLAGAALAALAHTGLVAAVLLAGPTGNAGRPQAESTFIVTLVDEPDVQPDLEPGPVPESEEEPVAENPIEPEPAPEPREKPAVQVSPAIPYSEEIKEPQEPTSKPSANASLTSMEPSMATTTEDATIELVEEVTPANPTSLTDDLGAPGQAFSTGGHGEVDMMTYLQQVRLQLARHAPKGVAGARNCEVEFQLSPAGEVIFVGIQRSSGSRLYDRRCLKSVTTAIPFPAAPPGASPSDLSFTIVMKQKR